MLAQFMRNSAREQVHEDLRTGSCPMRDSRKEREVCFGEVLRVLRRADLYLKLCVSEVSADGSVRSNLL